VKAALAKYSCAMIFVKSRLSATLFDKRCYPTSLSGKRVLQIIAGNLDASGDVLHVQFARGVPLLRLVDGDPGHGVIAGPMNRSKEGLGTIAYATGKMPPLLPFYGDQDDR
jgi:hypothetical protein